MSELEQQQNQPTEEELVDYDEEENTHVAADAGATDAAEKSGNYVAVHSSGFRDFYLKPEILRAIGDAGFEHPSEVQSETIPQASTGSDILCQAKSGLGKTAVFVISTLQQIEYKDVNSCICLVVAHTRELAYQIQGEYKRFAKYLDGLRISVVFGGVPQEQDEALVSNPATVPHVLIGTTGRVTALIKKSKLNLSKLRHFVIDECDKVLENDSMRNDVFSIFGETSRASQPAQVMLLSATMTNETRSIADRLLRKPFVEVTVDGEGKLTLHGLLQRYVEVEKEAEKTRRLTELLSRHHFNQAVVFVKSPQRATALDAILRNTCKLPSVCIHSGMKQADRLSKFKEFKDFEKRVLVSTDLFGRGIDVERVNLVINYDMPATAEAYLHRVGRAGRFGTKGLAISLVTGEEDKKILASVQDRFEVQVGQMMKKNTDGSIQEDEVIDPSLYTNA